MVYALKTKEKIAIVHYWLINWRGGEKVIEQLILEYPDADLYCHIVDMDIYNTHLKDVHKGKLVTSFLQKMPFAKRLYHFYLLLMPFAQELYDLSKYNVVVSSESGPAKGVITNPSSIHICYCHSPMRYIWDMFPEYLKTLGSLKRALFRVAAHYLRIWDQASSQRVDYFIANSQYVASRVEKYYRRESTVINPPVSIDKFIVGEEREDYYLMLGQLVEYKKADLACRAFSESGRQLVVIGEGPLYSDLKKQCPDNIKLLGRLPESELIEYLSRAKALLFPGVEDFGIVPLEAAASGTPVIAYRSGGATETVLEGVTGFFFDEQTTKAINQAVEHFENTPTLDSKEMRVHAERFSEEIFRKNMRDFIEARKSKSIGRILG